MADTYYIESQKNGVLAEDESSSTKTAFIPRRYREDIKVLQDKYDLVDGLVINLTLQEALGLLERDYPKTEAFIGLKNWLKRTYGVELVITSRYYSRKEEQKDV